MTMHAYCFPSGTAFERSKSIQYCRRICLHLEDLGNTQHARAAFLALCPPHDARFLADLLSFIHFYAVHQHRSTDPELTHALASADPEWAQSWDQYSVAPESFAQQTRQWFRAYRAGDAGSLRPPYHLYPWLLHGPRRRERLTAVALAATRWLARELPELRDFSGGRCALGLAEGEG